MLTSVRTRDGIQRLVLYGAFLLCLIASTLACARTGGALGSQFAESASPNNQSARQVADKSERLPPNVAPAEAARRASHEYGGRVLNVVLEDGPGGPYYRVKLLDGGRVRVVHVEARH